MANMRKIFSDTLMEMLKTKPLNAITITDIVNQCGVSRGEKLILLKPLAYSYHRRSYLQTFLHSLVAAPLLIQIEGVT